MSGMLCTSFSVHRQVCGPPTEEVRAEAGLLESGETPDRRFGHYFKIQISQISAIQQSTFLLERRHCCSCSPC